MSREGGGERGREREREVKRTNGCGIRITD